MNEKIDRKTFEGYFGFFKLGVLFRKKNKRGIPFRKYPKYESFLEKHPTVN